MSFPRYPAYRDSRVVWLGEVPAHWGVSKLKWQASVYSGRGKRTETGQFPLYGANGVIGVAELPEYSSDQVLIGRVGSAGAVNLAVGEYAVSDNALVVDNAERLQTRFCYYWFLTQDFSVDVSTTAQPLLTGSQLKDYAVALPPDGEQHTIAAFLDRETAKIDALVAEQEKLIALLQEKRQAVISHAVTKGLDPDVPMKDSGREWLGEVPAHWDVAPLKRDLEFITSGSRGWAEHYADDGALFIRIGNLTRDRTTLDLSDVQRVSIPPGAEGERTRVIPGDVLFSITAYLGSVAVVPEDLEPAYVSQHVALARLSNSMLTPGWVGYVALSCIGSTYLATQGYGGTKIQLSLDDVKNMIMTIPPRHEQAEITAFLDDETASTDALVADAARAMDLLKERRAALISAAVTGQIDVRCDEGPSTAASSAAVSSVPSHTYQNGDIRMAQKSN